MQNNKQAVIKINGETIRMSEFKDFSLDVLTYCFAHGIVDDGEDYTIVDFIGHVNGCLEKRILEKRDFGELTLDSFIALQSATVFVLGFEPDFCSSVDARHLGKFTNVWCRLLFTDILGSTFKDTAHNLAQILYGEVERDTSMCKPCMSHLAPETCDGCQFAE